MKKIGVAIMGLGVVGGGTFEILRDNAADMRRSDGVDLEVVKILDLRPQRFQELGVPEGVGTDNVHDLLNDDRVDIVVETIGGIEPARTFILGAFKAGKSVVTANKELIAKHWAELEAEAKRNRVGFYFEASCVGGVPIIRALDVSLQANRIKEIMGIINGTTNYILTKMTEKGQDYAEALKKAQQLGYAEADPTSDVEGYDAVYKLSILSSLAFKTYVPLGRIFREGISGIAPEDISFARDLGYKIKLLAIGRRNGGEIEAHVHPCLVPEEHPLASIRNSYNAVYVVGDHVDDLMFYGKGAGSHPTASAIVSDIVYCATRKGHRYSVFKNDGKLEKGIKFVEDFKSKYYFRLNALDQAGTLAKMTAILGRANVSIEQIIQKNTGGEKSEYVPIIFMTHESTEKAMAKALDGLRKSDAVASVESVIRVI